MSKAVAIGIGAGLLLVLVLFSMTYTVSFHEVAIKTRFGRLTDDSIVRDAGLKFRLPLFADQVKLYDTRLQLRESPLELVQTADNQQVLVRAFMLWKINTQANGPLDFHRSYADVDQANDSMIDQFSTALRSGVSRFSFDDLAGSKTTLAEAERAVREEMVRLVGGKGVEPVSVGVSQLVLSPKTTMAVLARMEASRKKLSEDVRIRGQSIATDIQSRAAKQADKIRAFAEQRAAEIRSRGDEDAAAMLKEMAQEQNLAVFLQWKDTIEAALQQNTTLVLPTAFEPFHMLNPKVTVDANGMPIPDQAGPSPLVPAPAVQSSPQNPQAVGDASGMEGR